MKRSGIALVLLLMAGAVGAQAAGTGAEVRVGTGVEKKELVDRFSVAADTKIWVWTKVTQADQAGAKVAIVFTKGGEEKFRKELELPSIPFRTNAYKTFRKGDGGDWKAAVLAADGGELGSATFTVEITP